MYWEELSLKDTIYITGHKNPDSDSICSAIAYAQFKKSLGLDAVPIRLGEINQETKFILDYFDIEEPMLVETVKQCVEDLNFDKVTTISSDNSIRMALNIMRDNNINSLPVIDDEEKLMGVITLSDLFSNYLEVWDSRVLGKAGTTVDNILDTLKAKIITRPKKPTPLDGKISILAMEPDSIKKYLEGNDIVICGNINEIHEFAVENGVAMMIVTGEGEPEEAILKKAETNGVTIISTPYDTFTTSRLIMQSVPVKYSMTSENLIMFTPDDLIDDVRDHMSKTRFRNYPVVDDDNKVIGLLSRYHLISSSKKKMILVDHNERSQSADGLEETEILEIIDHHRVADVFTGQPIYFRNEPVGSTATIIASIYFENGRRPTRKIAGLLAAAIISDTLLMKSPTSTDTDKRMLERLADIANIDVEKFAMEMFKAGTSLIGRTSQELLNQDFKSFTIKDNTIGISQVYTMDPGSLSEKRAEILEKMIELCKEKGYTDYIFVLTDIFNESSEMMVVGENKNLIASAFGAEIIDHAFYAPGILSRKKQIVPPITNVLTNPL